MPDPERLWVLRTIDLGHDAEQGIGRYPVIEGETYACLVSGVDEDGNEVAGIHLPDVSVPVATHLAWNPRDPWSGAPEQLTSMMGATHYFPPTRAARTSSDDPRRAIEERYASREDYLERVRDAAAALVAERYLLEGDIEVVVAACADRYDAAIGRS